MKDILISDFEAPYIQKLFQRYYGELGFQVWDWNDFWQEVCEAKDLYAWLRFSDAGEAIGFVQFQLIEFSNNLFREQLGFVRELWVSGAYQEKGYGTELLRMAENYFKKHGLSRSILKPGILYEFFAGRGYALSKATTAKDYEDVFVKNLA